MPPSLRTEKSEAKYQRAKLKGKSKDISNIKGERFEGMKLLYNDYPYDAFHDSSDMFLANKPTRLSKWVWWFRLGRHYFSYRGDRWDQIILNYSNNQSQSHIAHGHPCKLRGRKDFRL